MESIAKLIEQLGSTDQVIAYKARRRLNELARSADEAQKAKLAGVLAAELEATSESKDRRGKSTAVPKHSAKVRDEICRLLSLVGSAEHVPALKKALADLEVREMARWCLDRMTCPAAIAALLDAAVNDVGPEFRAGALAALGRKTGAEVIEALKTCAADADIEVRTAAAEALANHPDPTGDAVITAALKQSRPGARVHKRLTKARVRLAENLVGAGNKDAGKQIYQSILAGAAEPPQKKAAQEALRKLG